jgi:hypothetical protein
VSDPAVDFRDIWGKSREVAAYLWQTERTPHETPMSLRRLFAAVVVAAAGFGPASAADPPAVRPDVQRIEDAILGRGGARPEPVRPELNRPAKPEIERSAPDRPAAPKTETSRPAAPVVHLLSVASSNDRRIGSKVGDDARNVVAVLESSFAAAGRSERLHAQVILGGETTGRNLLAAVRGLSVRPQDTVVVFYSGHGGIDAQGRHLLTTGMGNVSTQDVLDAAATHRPRLTILLTDMCSTYIGGAKGHSTLPTGTARDLPHGRAIPWPTVENLFFSHRGVVDLTAAEPGLPSRVDHGGRGSYFTNALLEVLTTPYPALVDGLDRDGDLPLLRAGAAPHDRADNRFRSKPVEPQRAVGRSLGTWSPPGVALAH